MQTGIKKQIIQNYRTPAAWIVIFLILYTVQQKNYLLFHSFAEVFSVIVAVGIFMIAWLSKDIIDNNYIMLAAIAYFFVGFLDLIHTLSYEGMGVINSEGSNVPTQFWIAARYMQAASFLAAFYFIKRKLNVNIAFAVYTGIAAVACFSVFVWKIFPVSFAKGSGLTGFKIVSEYIIIIMLGVSLYMLHKNREYFDRRTIIFLAASIAATMISEIMFTLYAGPFEIMNFAGHCLKIIAFYLVYVAVIETGVKNPAHLLFKRLAESEEKYRALFDSMLDGFAYHKIITDETGEPVDYVFLEVNSAFERLTGLKKKDVTGRKVTDVIPKIKRDPAGWIERYGRVALTGDAEEFESYSERLDRWFSVSAYSTGKGFFTAVFEDISGRKKAEEVLARDSKTLEKLVVKKSFQLVRAKEEIEKNRRLTEIGTITATVAHELRNPLATIKLAVYNIKRKNRDNALEKNISNILKNSMNAQRILENMLDYARVKMPEAQKTDGRGFLDEVINEMKNIYEFNNCEISVEYEEDGEPLVEFDARQMKQVFQNLILNSVQAFEGEGGHITIKAQKDKNTSSVIFTIEDDGPGIKKKDLSRIFEPFYSKKAKGTGLGLPTCRQIVELHGGSINIESEEGKGTKAIIRIPLENNKKI